MQNANTTARQTDDTKEPSRPMRILVIDDNELDRQRLIRLCEKSGLRFDAVEIADLKQLPNALTGPQFDIIFIDYFLGGDTGLDALDTIAAHDQHKQSAAIMLAGEGQIAIAVEAMRRGCADYMTKAMMNVDTLQKSVATALERQMMSATLAEEDAARKKFEASVQSFANAATSEMRAILSATLRRVRKLRTYQSERGIEYSIDLHALETDIDRMWDALPDFQAATQIGREDAAKALRPPTRH